MTQVVVELAAVADGRGVRKELSDLQLNFPNLGLVLLAAGRLDPALLFQVGRTGVSNLVLMSSEGGNGNLIRALARARAGGVTALVTRSVAPYLPRREALALHRALDGVHNRWTADEYAEEVGLSRPFLSECLKAQGLPSAGHLLLWARLLHAAHWLVEPGRTAESVSRQLEYSSGAAFRRALKGYTGATPTEVVEAGGLTFVLDRFIGACRLGFRQRQPSAVA